MMRAPISTARARLGLRLLLIACAAGCGPSDEVACGGGTVLAGGVCIPEPIEVADAAPTFGGVAAVAPASSTALFLTWNDAQSATTAPERMRYAVFVASSGVPIDYTKPLSVTDPGASSFYVTRLAAAIHDVAVRAIDEAGRSDDNVVVKSLAPAPDATPPAFAGATTARASAAGAVTVGWEPARDDLTPPEAIVYYVYVASPAGAFDFARPTMVTRPGAASAIVRGLYDGEQHYRFVVRARDAAENVDANTASVTSRPAPDTTAPQFAGCKTALADSAGSVVVSWDPASDDTTPGDKIGYEIFAATPGAELDFGSPRATTAGGVTSIQITKLSPNTTWRFVCRARDFTGNRDTNLVERVARTFVDDTPPTFAGLVSAQVEPLARTVRFTWAPGSDDRTPADQLVYDVFEGEAPGAQSLSVPRASSLPGALSVFVTDLTPDRTLYWIVRARDQGGNHDSNTVEASGTIAVSFSRQVQRIFSEGCAVSGCHVPGNPMGGLVLVDGLSFDALVNVPSTQLPDTLRVKPGEHEASYLWQKISMNPPPVGWQMPAPATGSVMSPEDLDLVRRWINQGAQRN